MGFKYWNIEVVYETTKNMTLTVKVKVIFCDSSVGKKWLKCKKTNGKKEYRIF